MNRWLVKISLFVNYFVFAILLNSVGTVILQVQNTYGVSESSASVLEAFKDPKLRRDAAGARIGFETQPGDEGKVNVVLLHDKARIVYTVDMYRDVIDEIEISCGDMRGQLTFSYLQELEGVSEEFVEPRVRRNSGSLEEGPGIGWLFEIAGE